MQTLHKTLFISLFFLFTAEPTLAQGKLFTNATLHTGTGRQVTEGALGIHGDTIVFMGKMRDLDTRKYDTIINVNQAHIYPGFIAGNTTLGLFEIGAIKATLDYEEIGEIMPHVRTYATFNAESKVNATALSNGILFAHSVPRGRMLAGSSSVFHLAGDNYEESVVKKDDGMHLYWPENNRILGWWGEPGGTVKNKVHKKMVDELDDFFLSAKAYLKENNPKNKNLRMEAMRPVFNNKQTLYLHADAAKDIAEGVQFCRKHGVEKIVVVGGRDAYKVTQILKDNKIPVMLSRVHKLPRREDDDIDITFKLPALLHQEGITFCFENAGDMEQMQVRNFPFYAGTAVTYGLPYNEAVRALTLNAAEILGISARYGSLERGKSASFFISKGDALSYDTHYITDVYIHGEWIDLDNHQKRLYRKFKERMFNKKVE
ncbi:MAG: amidohydrolase family protein [Luteibaculaceae bacterium]